MKKIMVLFMVVFGLFLTGCNTEFWDDISGDSDTAEITIQNDCPWQVTVSFIADNDIQTETIGKSSKTFTVEKDVTYRIEVKGVYETSTHYFEKSFNTKKHLWLSWSTYTAGYQLKG